MARHKRNKSINLEGLRRKCSDTGRVGQVAHIHIEIPPSNKNYNPKETNKVIDNKEAGSIVFQKGIKKKWVPSCF